ncbi:Uncharacterised protein [Klebsiella pneumoniae]|nr:Uncharacterised protein [Klebsiella pneumoniae]
MNELINAEMSDSFYARTPYYDNRSTIPLSSPLHYSTTWLLCALQRRLSLRVVWQKIENMFTKSFFAPMVKFV